MIIYENINTKNHNNSIVYDKKGFNTSILLKTAYYNVYCTFNMFIVLLITKDVYKISCLKYYKNIITKKRNTKIMYDNQCLL